MESSDIRIDIMLRLETILPQSQRQQVLQNLNMVDGITHLRHTDATDSVLRISFDPYRISARDVLKWFAQQAIKAELLAPIAPGLPTPPVPTLRPSR